MAILHAYPLAPGSGLPAELRYYELTETATQGSVPGLRSYERELRTDETNVRGWRPFRSAIMGEDVLCQRVAHAPPRIAQSRSARATRLLHPDARTTLDRASGAD